MASKKYQIFLSSTYKDLVEERKAVEATIIRSGDIPVGMEAFPAADEEQFDFIKSVINDCDYYILIIAGKYGSVADDGVSYTEMEYNYAVAQGIPVLVFLLENPDDIPAKKSEIDPDKRKKLDSFRATTSKTRLVKFWQNLDELKLVVLESLNYSKATKSRPGWVRGDSIASSDLLNEVLQLKEENTNLLEKLGPVNLDISLPELPEFNSNTQFKLYTYKSDQRFSEISIEITWESFLPYFESGLIYRNDFVDGIDYWIIDESKSRRAIGRTIERRITSNSNGEYVLNKNCFDKFMSYYVELGVMNSDQTRLPFTESGKKIVRRLRISESLADQVFSLLENSSFEEMEMPF